MREILFRGKSTVNAEGGIKIGDWLQGYLFPDLYGTRNQWTILPIGEFAAIAYGKNVDPATVGQYTGLKDKNGTRIFEGDIVYTPSFFGISEKTWVSFQNGAFGVEWPHGDGTAFQAFTSFVSSVEWEVVGNIHDNPELRGRE